MTGAFLKGLVHGTLLCGAALAALSLAMPLAGRDGTGEVGAGQVMTERAERPAPAGTEPADPARVSVGAAGEPSAEASVAAAAGPDDAPVEDVVPADSVSITMQSGSSPGDPPAATSLPLPAGSEFARGTDLQPSAPRQLDARAAPATAAPSVTVLPADEPSPSPASLAAEPPAAPPAEAPAPSAPAAPAPVADEPDLPPAPVAEVAIPVPPPGKVMTPVPDRRPELAGAPDIPAGDAAPLQAAADRIATTVPLAPDPAARAGSPSAAPSAASGDAAPAGGIAAARPSAARTPSMPAPGPDLSTPPDLSDLRAIERN